MATYSNKFTIEAGEIVRIVFVDERAPIGGLPMAQSNAGEQVMTRGNALQLGEKLVQLLKVNQ